MCSRFVSDGASNSIHRAQVYDNRNIYGACTERIASHVEGDTQFTRCGLGFDVASLRNHSVTMHYVEQYHTVVRPCTLS